MDLDTFGQTLRLKRLELEKTLADVGRSAGCTRQNIHKVERALSNPTVQTLDRIAVALGMRLELRLVEGDEPVEADDPNRAERVALEARMIRLCRLVEAGRLSELDERLSALEDALIPRERLDEQRRIVILTDLLEEAGIDREVALRVAREVPDKPDAWDEHADRFAEVFDRARALMAN